MKTLFHRLLSTNDSFSPLFARLALGFVILAHGLQKVPGWFGGHGFGPTMAFFTQTLHIPWLFALAAILTETLGSVAVILGFLSRFAAATLGFTMIVAVWTVNGQAGFFMNWYGTQKSEGYEYHLLAIGLALTIVVAGGGRASLDSLLAPKSAPR